MQHELVQVERRRRSRIGLGCVLVVLALAIGAAGAVYVLVRQWQQDFAASGLDRGQANPALDPVRQLWLEQYLLQRTEQLHQPAGTTTEPVQFVIESGESANQVAQKLAVLGLLGDTELFINYLIYYGLDAGLVAGQYILNPQATVIELADTLSRPDSQMVELSFLPGWRAEEIANYLAVTTPGQMSADDFLNIAQRRRPIDLSRYEFLASLPPDASLEGYLFPGSYQVNPAAGAEALVLLMLDNFDNQVTPAMRQGFGTQGLSLREAVILASVVERETVIDEEKPLIASVFLNRLRAGMPLQADTTVQYAVGEPGAWWKVPLSAADLQVVSPYNTYQVNGLPPGPIANPDLGSLQAVAMPAESDFLYFVVDCVVGDGRHSFGVTYEQHLVNVARCQ